MSLIYTGACVLHLMCHFVWYLCRAIVAICNRVVLHQLVREGLIEPLLMWCSDKLPVSHRIFALTVSFLLCVFECCVCVCVTAKIGLVYVTQRNTISSWVFSLWILHSKMHEICGMQHRQYCINVFLFSESKNVFFQNTKIYIYIHMVFLPFVFVVVGLFVEMYKYFLFTPSILQLIFFPLHTWFFCSFFCFIFM